jgi:acetyl esterase/lipase
MIGALLLLAIGPKVDLDVVYSRVAGEELKMDVYHPVASQNGGKLGAVIVIHGGAWVTGKRQDMEATCRHFASKGLVAATIQYRLAPKYRWPAMLDDAQTAVRYVRANAQKLNIDPKRIAAVGASAGGHLALLLGFRDTAAGKTTEYPGESSKVAAVLNIFGPTDLTNAVDWPTSYDFMFNTVLGKPRAQAAEEIRDASPLLFVDAKSAPVFTVHGKDDPLVKVAQAEALDKRLRASGVTSELMIIPGMKHELPMDRPEVRSALETATAWLLARIAPAKEERSLQIQRTSPIRRSAAAINSWAPVLRPPIAF